MVNQLFMRRFDGKYCSLIAPVVSFASTETAHDAQV